MAETSSRDRCRLLTRQFADSLRRTSLTPARTSLNLRQSSQTCLPTSESQGGACAWAAGLSERLSRLLSVRIVGSSSRAPAFREPPSSVEPGRGLDVLLRGREGHFPGVSAPPAERRHRSPDPTTHPRTSHFRPTVSCSAALPARILAIVIRDAATNQTRAVLAGHTAPVTSLAFCSRRQDARLRRSRPFGSSSGIVAKGSEQASLLGHSDWVQAVVFSPDGARRRLRQPRLHRPALGCRQGSNESLDARRPREGPVRALAFSPDSSTLASGGAGRVVRLWDMATKMEERSTWEGHRSVIRSLAYSHDGATLVSAGEDHLVRLWDVSPSGSLRATIAEHTDQVLAAGFSPREAGAWPRPATSRRSRSGIPRAPARSRSRRWRDSARASRPWRSTQRAGAIVSSAYDRTCISLEPPRRAVGPLHLTLPVALVGQLAAARSRRTARRSSPRPTIASSISGTSPTVTRSGQLVGNTGNVILVAVHERRQNRHDDVR